MTDSASSAGFGGASADAVPDLGLPPRYQYREDPPNAFGWWSDPDGSDPPAAAQRALQSDAAPERALRLPLVPLPERLFAPLPAPATWPVTGASFAFTGTEEFLGAYLGAYLAPYLAPYAFVVSHADLATVGVHGPAYDDMNPGAALHWLHSWHQLAMGDVHTVPSTLAWVARVLSVVLWCVQPRIDLSVAEYDVTAGHVPGDEALLRLCRPGAVVGGGNLHATICLGWYAVVDASRRLSAALRNCPERLSADDAGLGVDAALRDALGGLGAVPGYSLAAWSSRSEALSSPYPHALWGQRRPVQFAQAQVDTLLALSALAGGQSRDRAKVPSVFTRLPRARAWDDHLRRNIHVYSDFSRRALGSVVAALRLVLHVAYRALVYYGYGPAWDPRDPPSAYCGALDRLRDAPVHRLHTVFDEFARRCALPRSVLWTLEAELYRTAARLAPAALRQHWGVPPDRPDSYDRAGALCPAGSYYIRIPLMEPPGAAQAPAPAAVPAPDAGS